MSDLVAELFEQNGLPPFDDGDMPFTRLHYLTGRLG